MSQEPTRTATPSPSVTAPPPPSPLGTMEPWNLVAAGYAAEALPYFQVFAKAALDCLNPGADARIVDVAAGPGTLSLLAAAAGMRVSAIDFSESMVAAFRERAQRANLMDRIDLRQGDGQQLPFESGAYDAAFSMFGLMFFPDRAAGLRELRRVLRPGKRALISSWVPFDGPFGELLRAAQEVIPGLTLGGGGKPPMTDPRRHRPRNDRRRVLIGGGEDRRARADVAVLRCLLGAHATHERAARVDTPSHGRTTVERAGARAAGTRARPAAERSPAHRPGCVFWNGYRVGGRPSGQRIAAGADAATRMEGIPATRILWEASGLPSRPVAPRLQCSA